MAPENWTSLFLHDELELEHGAFIKMGRVRTKLVMGEYLALIWID